MSRLEADQFYFEPEISSDDCFEDIVGKSPALQKVLVHVAVVAPTDFTVLLHGETGTGKELVARTIHNLSSRRDRSYVRMNRAAIPLGLLESELFGHERGAFTGALIQRKGRFELADRGTLFLGEIGDISLELQPKLLRAVQEQEFERLGSASTIHVNVRLIAATHRNLRAMIHKEKIRRGSFLPLQRFPHRDSSSAGAARGHPAACKLLCVEVMPTHAEASYVRPKASMEMLTNCPWKGNVSELANLIERAVIITRGEELQVPLAMLPTCSDAIVAVSSPSTLDERNPA